MAPSVFLAMAFLATGKAVFESETRHLPKRYDWLSLILGLLMGVSLFVMVVATRISWSCFSLPG